MKNVIHISVISFLFSLLFLLNSCFYTANSPPNKKLNLKDSENSYRQLYVSFFDSINKIKKTANAYAPPGIYSYSYVAAFSEDSDSKSGHYLGYGYDPGDSEKLALEFCEKNKILLQDKKFLGIYKSEKKPDVKKCKIIFTERYESEKYFSSKHKCNDLGIVEHPAHLKCVNEFEKTRFKIENSSGSGNSISEILSYLLILEIALTSLQPNTANSGVTCMMTSTALTGSGGLNGITCQ
jgi:hypothetical protein